MSKVISASFTSRKTPGTADFRDETEARENEQADDLAGLEDDGKVVTGPKAWFDRSTWGTANQDPEINERAGNARGYYLDRYRETLDRYAELKAAREKRGEAAGAPGMTMMADSYYRRRGEAEAPKKEKRKKQKLDPAPGAQEPNPEDFCITEGRNRRLPSKMFVYREADGTPYIVIARWDNADGSKTVRPYYWGSHDRVAAHWVLGQHPKPILYRLPEVLAGIRDGKSIVVLEGEKDVDGAIDKGFEKLGFVFTTTPGGALNGKNWQAWDDVDYSPLSGTDVTLVPDPGDDGRAWGEGIGHLLTTMNGAAQPAKVRVGTVPDNWSNGYGKGWGFGDLGPANASDADILKILTEPVPFEEWKLKAKAASSAKTQTQSVNWPDTGRIYEPYGESISGIDYVSYDKNGKEHRVPIANFAARIFEQIAFDDGAEVERRFRIQAFLDGRYYGFMVNTAEFPRVEVWSLREIGANAIIAVGKVGSAGKKDHLREAIQRFSPFYVPQRTIYAHTGWREIGGQQVYLHAGGGIGAAGAIPGIETEVGSQGLGPALLPEPPDSEELKAAIRSSLDLLDLGPYHIMAPQYAAVWRSTLGEANFSLSVTGKTGGFKTEIA